MDAQRFDDLSRFLGAEPSRRGVLAGLGSGLLALLAPATIRESPAAKKKKRNKRNKKKNGKKERCKKLGDSCTPGGNGTCCGDLICSATGPDEDGPVQCCKRPGEPCTSFDDCCSRFCFQETCLDT